MCATLVGGMDRLKREYCCAAKGCGVTLKVFTGKENRIASKVGQPDLLIVFTNKISHAAKQEVVRYAQSCAIPVRLLHSCGVSSLRQCLGECSECPSFKK